MSEFDGGLFVKVWWWILVARVWWGVCLRKFGSGFWLREFGNGFLVACVRWGSDCQSLVMAFGCAILVCGFWLCEFGESLVVVLG